MRTGAKTVDWAGTVASEQSTSAMNKAWGALEATAEDWSLPRVLAVHKTLMNAENPAIAGALRNGSVFAGNHTFMDSASVPAAMAQFLSRVSALESAATDPSIQAAAFMAGLLSIHPFRDGNGRTAFLFANWILHRAGAPVPVDLGQQAVPPSPAPPSASKPGPAVNRFQASLWAYEESANDHDASLM